MCVAAPETWLSARNTAAVHAASRRNERIANGSEEPCVLTRPYPRLADVYSMAERSRCPVLPILPQ